ncbi:MAG: hypothetical protein J2P52_16175, partial [Blastocatellia bacterium]|nr:hypothetical protein [Blastocatellia bacterium]
MITTLNDFFDQLLRAPAALRDAAVATLFPSACRVCGDAIEFWSDGVACSACWREIEREDADFCPKCPKCWALLAGAPSAENGARRRHLCESLAFDFARSCGPYD